MGNISVSGFFLLTDERPYPGTLILMTLQKTGTNGEKPGNSIAVYTKVIRWGSDGVGFRFVPVESKDAKNHRGRRITGLTRKLGRSFKIGITSRSAILILMVVVFSG